jgi:hypothetical protein
MVTDGPMDGEMFLAYVRQFLCPTLQPGDTVILDNLSSHKVAGVEEAITATGAFVLFLPPYSPDLNPIEKFFCQTQGAAPQIRQTRPQRPIEGNRRIAQYFLPKRMHKLLHLLCIWKHLNRIRSNLASLRRPGRNSRRYGAKRRIPGGHVALEARATRGGIAERGWERDARWRGDPLLCRTGARLGEGQTRPRSSLR